MALLAVVADGLHGAAFHGLGAKSHFLIGHGLLANVGKALVIVAGKEISCGLTAKVAVVYWGLYPQIFMTYFCRNAIIFYCNAAFFGTK